MFTRLLFTLCFLLISLMVITSCEYEVIEFDQPDPTSEIKFSNEIIPIFNKGCNVVGCHSAGHVIVDLTAANAYKDLFAKNMIDTEFPEQSKLYAKLVAAGSTHAGRSTPTDQEKILLWIRQGAKEN